MRTWLTGFLATLVGFFAFALPASAHEAYVLDRAYFWHEIQTPPNPYAFQALRNPHNLVVALVIAGSVLVGLILNFFLRRTQVIRRFIQQVERFAKYGPLFIRAAIAVSFYYSAASMSFLGPELPLASFPWPHVLQIILFAASIMIALGFLTELAALAALALYTISFFVYGGYMFTYFNYLGEIIVLLLFGMRIWSLDALFFKKSLFENATARLKKYETTIVRVMYGIALIFAAVTVKVLHPEITVKVITDWNLTQFHWLFPSDPLLVTLGAGLVEIAIGLSIVFGFELRLTVLVSLFYITLSLLYFRELVWPHYILYGISFNLLVQPEVFTLDHLFFERHRKDYPWWKRPFGPARKAATQDPNAKLSGRSEPMATSSPERT